MAGSKSSRGVAAASNQLAFLVHSQYTLNQNLPPDVDNKPLARQKRRRTSPDDLKILEEEFQRNPKPNKTARKDIVSRVALGEKEVQIWFQNRRQNSRRRPRSLDSSELKQDNELSSPYEEPKSGSVDVDEEMEERSSVDRPNDMLESNVIESSLLMEEQSPTALDESAANGQLGINIESQTTFVTSVTSSAIYSADVSVVESNGSQGQPSSQESTHTTSSGTGYVANRRNGGAARLKEEESTPRMRRGITQVDQARSLNQSSSYLRLSMTDDGKAKIVDRAVKSPSPLRSQPSSAEPVPRSGTLRRSYSAAGLNEDTAKGAANEDSSRKVPRVSAIGRSRDSRTWEFWCDSDARNSLIERAEQETSGSAAEAIGLMRSQSKRALRVNANKANTPVKRSGSSVVKPIRPPLKRSKTTHGRLQTKPSQTTELKKPTKKDKFDGEEWERPNTDSDKENWGPEDQTGTTRTQRSQPVSQGTRRVLGESKHHISQSSSLGALMARERPVRSTNRDPSHPLDVDDEVASFMSEGRDDEEQGTSPSSGEDLDCVQSLLSLSQGNWS